MSSSRSPSMSAGLLAAAGLALLLVRPHAGKAAFHGLLRATAASDCAAVVAGVVGLSVVGGIESLWAAAGTVGAAALVAGGLAGSVVVDDLDVVVLLVDGDDLRTCGLPCDNDAPPISWIRTGWLTDTLVARRSVPHLRSREPPLAGAQITKHIFVTGGVASSLGKGLTASSLGNLLKARGFGSRCKNLTPTSTSTPAR